MQVPTTSSPRVGITNQSLAYGRAAPVDVSGLVRGLADAGNSFKNIEDQQLQLQLAAKAKSDQVVKFKALTDFNEYQINSNTMLHDQAKDSPLDDGNFYDRTVVSHENYTNQFITGLPPELQDEFKMRASEVRQQYSANALKIQDDNQNKFVTQQVDKAHSDARGKVTTNPDTLEQSKFEMDSLIDNSPWSEVQKQTAKAANAAQLEGIAYGKEAEKLKMGTNQLASSVKTTAAQYGYNAVDMLTVISYETGGKFSTSVRGGKDNKYIGLFQAGPEEQQKFGVYLGQPAAEQVDAMARFLHSRGFKPGMSLLDMYSTVNAGSPGRYNASDKPGETVASHVDGMPAHREKAIQMLNGKLHVEDTLDQNPRYQNVSFEDRVALRTDAEAKVNVAQVEMDKQSKASYDNFLNSTLMDAADGKVGQKQLDDMLTYNQVTDYGDRQKIQGAIDNFNKETNDTTAALAKLTAGESWSYTDANDNKLANALFNNKTMQQLSQKDEGVFSAVNNFASQTQVIPDTAVKTLQGMTTSYDSKVSTFALDALDKLHQSAPLSYNRQVDNTTDDMVIKWKLLKEVLPADELAKAISPAATQEKRQNKRANDELFTQLINDKTGLAPSFDEVLKEFKDPRSLGNAFLPSKVSELGYGPEAGAMRAEWKALLQHNFNEYNGDLKSAQWATIKQLKRVWGTTNVGGTQKLMAHPIENTMPKINGGYEAYEEQVRGDFKLTRDTKFELISDVVTDAAVARPVNAGSRDRQDPVTFNPPSYKVAAYKDGKWEILAGRYQPEKTAGHKKFEDDAFDKSKLEAQIAIKRLEIYKAAQMLRGTGITPPKELVTELRSLEADLAEMAKKDVLTSGW